MIDQGFYDWGSTDDAGDAQALAPNYANEPEYGGYDAQPEAQQDPGYATGQPAQVPMARPSYQGSQPSSVSVPEEPLTVMFRNGRAPATMQNYMLNGSTLTDLDRQHYEQIPLNQIDVAATQQANRARGLDFKIPAGPGE